jgi:spore cortex formation protein SpoVR/YcgB (stage V sporulation)
VINEQQLIQKLQRIERLHSGATTPGEKEASAQAIDRIRQRLEAARQADPPIEYRFTLNDMWSRKLFVALLRRYGIEPYRYYRQRHTTVMAKVPCTFVDETLWPEFKELDATLQSYLEEVTNRVVSESVFADSSEAVVVNDEPKSLSSGSQWGD